MKKDVEQLLVFLIPVIFIEKVFQVSLKNYFTGFMRGDDSGVRFFLENLNMSVGGLMSFVSFLTVAVPLMSSAVVAVWVWRLEKRNQGRPVLWALGAVFLKYWVLLLYIGQQLHLASVRDVPKST